MYVCYVISIKRIYIYNCVPVLLVLGRVVEKCAQHEQQNTSDTGVESTDIKLSGPSVSQAQLANATDVLVQELQHIDVTTELSCQCTEEKSQG